MRVLLMLVIISMVVFTIPGCSKAPGEEVVEGEMTPTKAPDVQIDLLNGCGDSNGISALSEKLETEGYTINATGHYYNAEGLIDYSLEETEIASSSFATVAAENIAVAIGGGKIVTDEELGTTVEVRLGRDLSEYTAPDTVVDGLYISLQNKAMYQFKASELIEIYPCAIGKEETPTPTGTFEMYNKSVDPTWYWEGKAIPPGPENGLGARFLGISNSQHHRGYGVHGTNEPDSIGTAASHGCLRTYNEYAIELYDSVDRGETIIIGD